MSWQIALALFFITNTAQSLWQRAYSQKSELPESYPPALSYVLALLPLSIVVGLFIGPTISWSPWLIFLLIVEGVFIAIFNWMMFRAIRRLPVAIFQLISQSYAIVTITLGWILLSETLTVPQIIGAVFLLAAAIIATQAPVPHDENKPKAYHKLGIMLAVCAALALGIGLVTEKAALHYTNVGAYFIFGFGTQAIALAVIALKDTTKKVLKSIRPHDLRRSLIMGAISAFNGFFYVYALQHSDNISLITALCAFCLPLAVVAAFVILKERENIARMLIAAGLGTLGLIITTL